MENKFASRVALLQSAMAGRGIDALIISNTDPHSSEYPAGRWCQVEWVSGFTGEAAEIVITARHAGLWTDTRYFIQAGIQLEGTGIALHKTRVPDQVLIPEYLATALKEIPSHPVRVAYDGLCQSVESIKELKAALEVAYGEDGYRLVDLPDFLSEFWEDRPEIPATPVIWPDQKLFGETRAEKLEWLRKEMASRGCRYMLVTALDEIAWLLNVRGEDIDYNPYVISYLVVSDNAACWFVRDTDNVPHVPEVTVTGYDALQEGIASMAVDGGSLLVDPSTLNGNVHDLLEKTFTPERIVLGTSPIIVRKAVKNRTEIANIRKAHLMDGLAMEKFLHWVEVNVKSPEPITEWDASVKLTELRSEIEGYHGNSFENISAYGENAALPHYSTPVTDSAVIEKKGLYLVDSGGQYDFGTTDITRTVPVGRCSRREKEDYTLVLKGMIDLAMAVFPKGTAGCQIDALAREPLWKNHRSFGHGTGHGIGYYLGVHEGPQSIRQNFNRQPILPGMVTSDEPGLYREGKYGIRHENVLLCVEDGDNEFASWLKFETLTLCHIDTKPVRTRLLTDEELSWLNSYNKRVYKTLSPYLDPETRVWLKKKCRKLSRGWFE